MHVLTRRNFIKSSLAAGVAFSSFLTPRFVFSAPDSDTVLVVIMLAGGPDFRYFFVPPYDSSSGTYGNEFWTARARTYELSPLDSDGLQAKSNEYLPVTNQIFRMHPNSGWLKSEFEAGNVALISNVYASRNRDHAHSILKLERGDLGAGQNDTNLSGWGGRLAKNCGTNVCSVSRAVRQFCYGPHPDKPLDHDNSIVIDGNDTRKMGLYEYTTDIVNDSSWRWSTRGIMSRALTSYYAAKSQEIAQDSPYQPIFQHEQSVRNFGRLVNQRLETLPLPQSIIDLYTSSADNVLNNRSFGRQIRNMYDVMACDDLLATNIISADYGGWDHHRYMKDNIEPKMNDLFGGGKGLDTLFTELRANQPGKADRVVVLVYGEFGRQLAANGDYGTDHGEGNYAILIGDRVNGGVRGEMFPQTELSKFAQPGADIEGLTSYERIIAALCETIKQGSASQVVPGYQNSDIESHLDLFNLIS